MSAHPIIRAVALLGVLGVAAAAAPAVAKAQNRGTMQVTATVLDSRAAFAALQAARTMTNDWVAARPPHTQNVSTVAQVSVTPRTETREDGRPRVAALVVTIDYAKN